MATRVAALKQGNQGEKSIKYFVFFSVLGTFIQIVCVNVNEKTTNIKSL